ncbi:MAG: nitric oxide reductase transcriptional regulator NorR [Candidatus Competibacteraceae bacterium]|nr:nitric oxide reductase transcriptional regulator NorR [Candidatus Competibacteraceae bacterium]
MTPTKPLASLPDVVADLSRHLPPQVRLKRLLEALMDSFPCDAAALLQLDGDYLVPRAVKGLSQEALGRRFVVAEQPRLQEILHSRGLVRFPADSSLPDPYDGLVDTPDGHIYVHDCMGAALHIDGRFWGILTLDALTPGVFNGFDPDLFKTFVSVAAASIRAADVIDALEVQLKHQQQVQASWLDADHETELLGESEVMVRLQREVYVVARSDVSVLIQGETGVGKELVARLIHLQSPRAQQPMVQVNCAALPEAIAESELFGHVNGAFSGASQNRAGKFELADGGTLLLDEVGELPLSIQATLLRALQSGEIQRVGSDLPHRVDTRIIAVTNRDLAAEVKAGRFRADLYHRLNVYPITVPPLRERGPDVHLLAGHFLQRCERKQGLRGVRLSKAAQHWLSVYPWPGNIRELEHTIIRAVVKTMSEGHSRDRIIELTPQHLGAEPVRPSAELATDRAAAILPEITLADALEQFKRELLGSRLHAHGGNVAATARSLGLDRGNLYRQLKRLGITSATQ